MANVLRFSDEQYAELQKRRESKSSTSEARSKRGPKAAASAAGALPVPLERDVLADVLAVLQMHPRVGLHWRMNVGAMEVDGRWIQFAFPGCSDVLGQLTDGRMLAIEVKRPGKDPTPAQEAFLRNVARNGGCAFVARSADDVWKMLPMAGRSA